MEENLSKSLSAIEEAAANHADLILFPEVQLTEFFPQYSGTDVRKYLVSEDSDIVNSFCRAAGDNHIMAVPNVYFSQGGKAYDASIMIERTGEILGIQKMVHIAQAPAFYEQDYYAPSDDGFKVFNTSLGNIGIVVCFDRHYPESIRTQALTGADLILIPTANIKAEPSEMFEWEIRVQAFQSSVAIAMCNRTGDEGEMQFSGESILVDASGNVLEKADDREQILYAEVDLKESLRIRNSRPYTSLRRPECYCR